MTNIEQKAQQLLNEVRAEYPLVASEVVSNTALCRAIEQHEAFRQEVSDALEKRGFYIDDRDLGRFIITKPDPLEQVMRDALSQMAGTYSYKEVTSAARTALAKRGGRIVFDD